MKIYNRYINNGVHLIEIIIQFLKYKGRIIMAMGGNYYGKDVLDFDFEIYSDDDFIDDCNLYKDEDVDIWTATLHDKDGKTIEIEEDADFFNDMIVKKEIVGHFKTMDEAREYVNVVSDFWE